MTHKEIIAETLGAFVRGMEPTALETWNFFQNLDDEELGQPSPMPRSFEREYNAAIAQAAEREENENTRLQNTNGDARSILFV